MPLWGSHDGQYNKQKETKATQKEARTTPSQQLYFEGKRNQCIFFRPCRARGQTRAVRSRRLQPPNYDGNIDAPSCRERRLASREKPVNQRASRKAPSALSSIPSIPCHPPPSSAFQGEAAPSLGTSPSIAQQFYCTYGMKPQPAEIQSEAPRGRHFKHSGSNGLRPARQRRSRYGERVW